MNIFQSKQECFIREILRTRGFFEEDIGNCDIEGIANNIFIHHAFKDFASVVICTPLAHFTLAKAILVLLSWMQVDHQVSDHSQLCAFIAHLSKQAGQLARKELVESRTLVKGMSSKQLLQRVGNMFQNS